MTDTAHDKPRPRGRTLTGSGRSIRPISLAGSSSVTLSETGPSGYVGSAAPEEGFPIEMALAESAGPWRRDRVSLSLEAQVLMMEMKAAAQDLLEFAGQLYSNAVSQLKIAAGRFLLLEPYGGYRLRWKN